MTLKYQAGTWLQMGIGMDACKGPSPDVILRPALQPRPRPVTAGAACGTTYWRTTSIKGIDAVCASTNGLGILGGCLGPLQVLRGRQVDLLRLHFSWIGVPSSDVLFPSLNPAVVLHDAQTLSYTTRRLVAGNQGHRYIATAEWTACACQPLPKLWCMVQIQKHVQCSLCEGASWGSCQCI